MLEPDEKDSEMPDEFARRIARLKEMHPSDIAAEIDELDLDELRLTLREFSDETAADIIPELPDELQTELLENMRLDRISEIIPEMYSDDAADALGNLSPERLSDIMETLPEEEVEDITSLLEYPDDCAGGIMQTEVLAVGEHSTLAEAREAIRNDEEFEDNQSIYIYVVDVDHRLRGILRVRDLLFRDLRLKVRDVMISKVRSVTAFADQEEIANRFQKYNYPALPVVDETGKLLGLVTSDDVIDVIQEEATEDMQRMVGLSGEEMMNTPWRRSVKNRLPWLCINVGTAFVIAWVIGFFEPTIERFAVLALFIPVVGLLGGNTGSQTLTIVVRSLALGEIQDKEWRGVLVKEMMASIALGLTIGALVGLISWIWKGSYVLGVVICLATSLNMLAAAMAGVLVPISLRALKVDPALASSIMVTTVTDVVGFFIFLSLATIAMSQFPQLGF